MSEAWLAVSEPWLTGPGPWLAGAQAWLAGPKASQGGQTERQVYKQTNKQTNRCFKLYIGMLMRKVQNNQENRWLQKF